MENSNKYKFNALIHEEDGMYVIECVEFGTVSQGRTIDEAVKNIIEATELYIEDMPKEEIEEKLRQQVGFLPIQLTPSTFNIA